eukprot:6030111-Pleurochrysis_carterae.AAC.3
MISGTWDSSHVIEIGYRIDVSEDRPIPVALYTGILRTLTRKTGLRQFGRGLALQSSYVASSRLWVSSHQLPLPIAN